MSEIGEQLKESVVLPETLHALDMMTDEVLDYRQALDGVDSAPIVRFKVESPNITYGLKIYSIPEGRWGFNTVTGNDTQNHSARWSVHVDRGDTFGAAFDNKGTIYKDGRFEPVWFSDNQANIQTGSIDELVKRFFDDPDSLVSYSLLFSLDNREVEDTPESRPLSFFNSREDRERFETNWAAIDKKIQSEFGRQHKSVGGWLMQRFFGSGRNLKF